MDTRAWFTSASSGFAEIATGIGDRQLEAPGLGEWSVRDLLGHACRAFLTVEAYLAERAGTESPELDSPRAYFDGARDALADPAAVAERGRAAGRALGERPQQAVREIAARVIDVVAATRDGAPVVTPVGVMRLSDYLPTRAFELTVHGIDLARATGQPIPAGTRAAVAPALDLAVSLADPDQALALLLAATGRDGLSGGVSVL